MVSAGPGVEVTVLVAKSEVLNYNNLSKSKEDAIKGEECGEEKNRERSNWQGPKSLADEKERSQVEEPDEELEVGDSL